MGGMKDTLGDRLYESVYPQRPGHKTGGTSAAAAKKTAPGAGRLRLCVLAEIRKEPGTPDEIAARLDLSILSVRPRISELIAMGKVRKTEVRRKNESGMSASVMEVVP